jgi:hypothetical protein
MVEHKNGIFIFTKNRETVVANAIRNLVRCQQPIFVIDDSTSDGVRYRVAALCKQSGVYYHGLVEQAQLLKAISNIADVSFMKVLGDGQWNLGYARNHAILLAFRAGLDKMLLLDDDITIDNLEFLNKIFSSLDHHDVVGSQIIGMPDDSILGHIASKVKIEHKRLYSGGCLACKVSNVNEHFINVYNEDWIWQYIYLPHRTHTLVGQVHHKMFDPFDGWQQKMLFQETGELLVDGLENASPAEFFELLNKPEFWEQEIQERKRYLIHLKDRCEFGGETQSASMINYLLSQYSFIKTSSCSKLFEEYLNQRHVFQKVKETFHCSAVNL